MAGKPQVPAWKAPLLVAAQARHQVANQNVANQWKKLGQGYAGYVAGQKAGTAHPVAPPASQSSAPAAPAWQDSTYGTAISNLQGNLGNLSKNLVNQATGLGEDYGINYSLDSSDPNNPLKLAQQGTNPDGTPRYLSIDDNVDIKNPFSRAALLKKSYEANSRGDGNRMAAGGQLYSGAYQNAQDTDTRNFQGGQDSLIKDFQGRFGGLLGQWLTAQGTEQAGEGTASSDAIGRWIAAGSPAPPTPQQATTAAKTAEVKQAKRAAVQNKNRPLRRH